MIEINGLTKSFGDLKAVNNLTINFTPGVTGLLGHNGAGKSTLFRLIADVYRKDEGEVKVYGHPSDSLEAKKCLFFLNDNPYGGGNNWKAVRDFYANFYEIDSAKYEAMIANFGLPMNKNIDTYSKGMKRQLFLALALSVKAEAYLLDEAFDGIDPMTQEVIKQEIIALGEEGKTIVLSSHNIASLERLADRFVILYKGKLSNESESGDMGESMVKYQCVPEHPFDEKALEAFGMEVISFKKVGSIYNFVLVDQPENDEIIKDRLKPRLLEKVALDPDEAIALEMALAKKRSEQEGGENHE